MQKIEATFSTAGCIGTFFCVLPFLARLLQILSGTWLVPDYLKIALLLPILLSPLILIACMLGIGASLALHIKWYWKTLITLANVGGLISSGWYIFILLNLNKWGPINPG